MFRGEIFRYDPVIPRPGASRTRLIVSADALNEAEHLNLVLAVHIVDYDPESLLSPRIEGYGWGALSIHLLMYYILGLREEEGDRITIAPILPQALRKKDATYKVAPVPWGKYALSIEYRVKTASSYQAHLRCRPRMLEDNVLDTPDISIQQTREYQYSWEGTWGEERSFHLPDLAM